MKKELMLASGAAIAALLTGCASSNCNGGAAAMQVQLVKTCQADLAIQPKTVSGEAKVKCLFGCIAWGVSDFADDAFTLPGCGTSCWQCTNTMAKQGATYDACHRAQADCLVGAKYEIHTENYVLYKTVKCKVTGFPAMLKGVKE